MTKVGIFGVGNVGLQLISQLENCSSCEIVGLFSRSKKDLPHQFYDNCKELIDHCDIVVELIGGITIARDIIFYALSRGKKIVTANKYFLAEFGEIIFPQYRNSIKFEAAVCSIMPIIRAIDYLQNMEISEISGILNGTSNYILSQLACDITFDQALNSAKQLGYAESDPTFDIEGIDALQKAQILHFLAFGFWAKDFSSSKIIYAKKGQKSVTNIVRGKITIENKFDDNFSSVSDNYNAVNIKTVFAKDFFLKGIGAGGLETAYAVKQDILQFVKDNDI